MTRYPRRAPDLRIHAADGGFIVERPAHDRVHFLNATAVLILELCDGATSPAEIAELLRAGYEDADVPAATVEQTLARLGEAGLVHGPPRLTHPPCTRDTARCEFWTWSGEALRPACCTDHLIELLAFTTGLLAAHGILHWIDFGTLLGAVRAERLIPWDPDVDVGVLRSDLERVRALAPAIERAGHWLDPSDPYVWRVVYSRTNTTYLDLYPWTQDGDRLTLTYEPWSFPRAFVETLTDVALHGRCYPAPTPVPTLLAEYRYGPDYMTPARWPAAVLDFDAVARARIERTVRAFVRRRRRP